MAVTPELKAKIQALEQAHKAQFVDLVMANNAWLKMLPKIHGKPKDSKEYKSMMDLAHVIAKNAGKWYSRQVQYETRAGAAKSDKDIMKYFLDPKNEHKLILEAKQFISPASSQTISGQSGVEFFNMMNHYITTTPPTHSKPTQQYKNTDTHSSHKKH